MTDVIIGSPGQRIRAGLDFGSSEAVAYYLPEACPPFVGNCFNSAHSESFDDHQDDVSIAGEGVHTRLGRCRLQAGPTTRSSVRFSEVAGMIGAGPESPLFNSQTLFIEDDDNDSTRVRISDSYPYSNSDPFGFEVGVPAERGLSRWVTAIRFTFAYCANCFRDLRFIEYSPEEEDLVVPGSARGRLIQHLGHDKDVGSDGRIFAPCSWAPLVELDFESVSLWIRVNPNQFRVPASAGDTTCLFRIRFDDSLPQDTIKIGRILTRSAGGIALDYRRKVIRISRINVLRQDHVSGFSSAVSLVPVFQPPFVSATGIELEWPALPGTPRNLVLSSLREATIQFGALMGRGFVFFKTEVDRESGATFRIVRQLTNLAAPDIDLIGHHMSFSFDGTTAGGEWDILMSENAYTMLIFKLRRQAPSPPATFLEELDLGIPECKLQDSAECEGDDSSVCSICLDPIGEGELQQALNPCKHRFHFRCITNWLKTRYSNPTCPVCRTKVPKLASIPESLSTSFRGTS